MKSPGALAVKANVTMSIIEAYTRQPIEAKWCNRCEQFRPVADFDRHGPSGYQSYCRGCSNAYHRSRYQPRPRMVTTRITKQGVVEYRCPRCELWQAAGEWSWSAGKRSSSCKACRRLRSRTRGVTEPVKAAKRRRWNQAPDDERLQRQAVAFKSKLARQYNMTLEQYWQLVQEQGGRCGICDRLPKDDQRLQVDHDHRCCAGPKSCGRCVRGLLCGSCNGKLALVEYFPNAVAWLDRRVLGEAS